MSQDQVQIPQGITVEQAFNYLFHHITNGREKDILTLDQRGLGYFKSGVHTDVQIGLPPREESHGNGRVYLRAVF
jgi:hypothetical protein